MNIKCFGDADWAKAGALFIAWDAEFGEEGFREMRVDAGRQTVALSFISDDGWAKADAFSFATVSSWRNVDMAKEVGRFTAQRIKVALENERRENAAAVKE